MIRFDPRAWFWVVGGDETRAWSSAAGAYVQDWPEDSFTRTASEADLSDVLRPYGLQGPHVATDDYARAIQAHVDAVAASRGYGNGVMLASYKDSTIPQWAAEAEAFIPWRDQVWASAYATLAAVQAGQQQPPTLAGLIASLPAIQWSGA